MSRLLFVSIASLSTACSGCSPEFDDSSRVEIERVLPENAEALPICENTDSVGGFDELPPPAFRHVLPAFTGSDEQQVLDALKRSPTAGVVAADLDDDGRIDLYLPQGQGRSALFRGTETGWEEWSVPALEDLGTFAVGAQALDVNGDGRLDLAVYGEDLLRVFLQRDGTFVDASDELELPPIQGVVGALGWADVDLDGDVDLYVGGYVGSIVGDIETWDPVGVPDQLLLFEDGRFVDATSTLPGEGPAGAALDVLFQDLDDDGDPDLLVLNDFGPVVAPPRLFENRVIPERRGAQWSERTVSSGLEYFRGAMGAVFEDLDGDGLLDVAVADLGGIELLRGLGDFQWLDVRLPWAPDVENIRTDVPWSVVTTDVRGDGAADLFLTYGPLPLPLLDPEIRDLEQPDRLLVDTSTTEVLLSEESNLLGEAAVTNSRGAASADLNRDGVLDLIVGVVSGAPRVLRGRCTDASRLVVELEEPLAHNSLALGSQVTVRAGNITRTQRWDPPGVGSFSGSEWALFFGLAGARTVDAIEVRWPDGKKESFEGCVDCRIRLVRDEGTRL